MERAEDGGASRGGGPKSSEAPHSFKRLEEVKTAEVHVQHVQNGEPFSVKMIEKVEVSDAHRNTCNITNHYPLR